MSNLSIDVIRSWERRYGIVSPARGDGGIRLYADADVRRLSLARSATQLGHPIRQVAQMTTDELEKLVGEGPRDEHDPRARFVERILAAVQANDAALAEQLLISATLLTPTRELVLAILAPLLREVGKYWEQGSIAVWQEHLVSALIRKTALAFPRPPSAGSPMLFATPPFEAHEFGIALAAMLAASHGRVAYNLGPNVPIDQVTNAAQRLKASTVVIGMTRLSAPVGEALDFATALDAALAPSATLWLGGSLGAQIAPLVDSHGARGVASLEEFDRICQAAA